MKTCTVVFVIAVTAIFFGCGDGEETATSANGSSGERAAAESTSSEEKANYPVPAVPPKKDPLQKLVVKDLEVGKGPIAGWGDTAIVRYVGVYYKTGKIYSQHWGSTFSFKLDGKSVGPGWQKGIHGMRVGGRRELLIPSDLLFGDGDLAYVVSLVDVRSNSYEQKGPFAAIVVKGGKEDPEIDSPNRPAPKKLLFRTLEEGSGPAAKRGDEVAIRYAGAMYETGEVRYGGTSQLFRLGFGGFGAAFERGLEGMRAGGRRELIVPSRFLGGSGAVDYLIELTRLEPASEQ